MSKTLEEADGTDFEVATDTVTGVEYQVVKIAYGTPGSASYASSAAGLPVAQQGSWSVSASQTGTWNISDISGTISLPTGASTAALQSTTNSSIGATNETAAASDSATSGLNGLIKRLLAKWTAGIALVAGSALIGKVQLVKSDGTTVVDPQALGRNVMASSTSVTHASDDPSVFGEYEYVAASTAATPLGATGASGDYLAGLLIIPASTSPGSVTLTDGAAGSARTIFAGGASSLTSLIPFFVPLGVKSIVTGGWQVATGANVAVYAVGDFT
jgi:hypothetical protein